MDNLDILDLLERVRMDYGHADLAQLRRYINEGRVDQEEAHLAIINGRKRHLNQDDVISWNDRDGYDGFLQSES